MRPYGHGKGETKGRYRMCRCCRPEAFRRACYDSAKKTERREARREIDRAVSGEDDVHPAEIRLAEADAADRH